MILPVSIQLQNFVGSRHSPIKQQTSDSEYHYVYSGNDMNRSACHTSHMYSWQQNHKQCRNGGGRQSLEVPLLPSDTREHEEAKIRDLPVLWEKLCKQNYRGNSNQNTIQPAFPVTSCKSSRNVLGAFLASRAFACRVLRLVPFGCFFCIYPASGVQIVIPFFFNITNNCSRNSINAWLFTSTQFTHQ